LQPWDPDYVPSGSAFAVSWSPWVYHADGSRAAVLAYTQQHYVGFRRVVLDAATSRMRADPHDLLGACCHLGTDAFFVWEDDPAVVAGKDAPEWEFRALLATPFVVRAVTLRVSSDEAAVEAATRVPIESHPLGKCGVGYPPPGLDAADLENPVTGGLGEGRT
jgi:hypothetical protein